MNEQELAGKISGALIYGSDWSSVTNKYMQLVSIEAFGNLLQAVLDEKHDVVDGDCWYTCDIATEERDGGERCSDSKETLCTCSRRVRVPKYLKLLAEMLGVECE